MQTLYSSSDKLKDALQKQIFSQSRTKETIDNVYLEVQALHHEKKKEREQADQQVLRGLKEIAERRALISKVTSPLTRLGEPSLQDQIIMAQKKELVERENHSNGLHQLQFCPFHKLAPDHTQERGRAKVDAHADKFNQNRAQLIAQAFDINSRAKAYSKFDPQKMRDIENYSVCQTVAYIDNPFLMKSFFKSHERPTSLFPNHLLLSEEEDEFEKDLIDFYKHPGHRKPWLQLAFNQTKTARIPRLKLNLMVECLKVAYYQIEMLRDNLGTADMQLKNTFQAFVMSEEEDQNAMMAQQILNLDLEQADQLQAKECLLAAFLELAYKQKTEIYDNLQNVWKCSTIDGTQMLFLDSEKDRILESLKHSRKFGSREFQLNVFGMLQSQWMQVHNKILELLDLGVLEALFPEDMFSCLESPLEATEEDAQLLRMQDAYFMHTDHPDQLKRFKQKMKAEQKTRQAAAVSLPGFRKTGFNETPIYTLLMGIFFNFVVNDPLVRRTIESLPDLFLQLQSHTFNQPKLQAEYKQFITESQTQWISSLIDHLPMVTAILQPISEILELYRGKKTDQIEAHLDFITLQLSVSTLLQVMQKPLSEFMQNVAEEIDCFKQNICVSKPFGDLNNQIFKFVAGLLVCEPQAYLCSNCLSHYLQKDPESSYVALVDYEKSWTDVRFNFDQERRFLSDYQRKIEQNDLLRMIERDRNKSLKSVTCACNSRVALLEQPSVYSKVKRGLLRLVDSHDLNPKRSGVVIKGMKIPHNVGSFTEETDDSSNDSAACEENEDEAEVFEIGDLRDLVLAKMGKGFPNIVQMADASTHASEQMEAESFEAFNSNQDYLNQKQAGKGAALRKTQQNRPTGPDTINLLLNPTQNGSGDPGSIPMLEPSMQPVHLGEELEQYIENCNLLKADEEVKKTKKKKKKGKKTDQGETEPLPASQPTPPPAEEQAPEPKPEEPEDPVYLNYEDVNQEVNEFAIKLEALKTEAHDLYREVGMEDSYFGKVHTAEDPRLKARLNKYAMSKMKKAYQKGEFSSQSETANEAAPAEEAPPTATAASQQQQQPPAPAPAQKPAGKQKKGQGKGKNRRR